MKIQHDFHVHTKRSLCSDGTGLVKDYLEQFRKNGIHKVGFADHFWEGTPIEKITESKGVRNFYTVQNFAHVADIREEIAALTPEEKEGMTIYFGCECEYDPYARDLAITEEYAEQFDMIIVPNSHTHMMMPKSYYEPYEKHKEFMMQAYMDVINSKLGRYVTSMAHPFEAVCCPYDYNILINMITDDEFRRMFDATAEKGIAIEVNVASLFGKTPEEIEREAVMRMYRLAKECGCKFTFGSDAHEVLGHIDFANAAAANSTLIADLLELTEDDLHPLAR